MATEAEASTGNGGGPPSHLPLQLIPRRVRQQTSVSQGDVAGRAPATPGARGSFTCGGRSFPESLKVSRISPEKLKSADGVKILAEQLGGSWGRLQVEDKFHYFEQTIDSYIARHDAQLEELLSRRVGLEEIRAYVLLRHSQLAAEDKKRVIVESKGDLQYSETIKAIRLYQRGTERTKVYDVNMTEVDAGEDIHMASHEEQVDEEEVFAYFFEQYDEDALYIAEFEDGIIEAVQESNLAPVFSAYQEARARLRDKAKARGFWPVGKSAGRRRSKGYGKKGGWSGSGFGKGKRPKTLAERISTSSCRLCGAVGHWKRECPKNTDNQQGSHNKVEMSHLATDERDDEADDNSSQPCEFLHDLPDMDELSLSDDQARAGDKQAGERIQDVEQFCFAAPEVKPSRCR
ncbi:unnamed protein product [Symbiodinium sp. CCMP2592]|nr:unnamed protein product [Symbiodinium sp. CCMP2592]